MLLTDGELITVDKVMEEGGGAERESRVNER